jgi:tRNA pseudouridine55 synthase
MATSVLVLLFGEALKLSAYLTLDAKSYIATVTFGTATDTLDADGSVTLTQPLAPGTLTPERVEVALATERTRAFQVPPAVSSIKVGGERAHRLTRRGESPSLEPRPVRVERLVLGALGEDRLTVEVTASKGYYVRSLARDLGEALGTPAHLSTLARTGSGAFTLADAVAWPPNELPSLVPLTTAARRCLPCVELTAAGAAKARLGQRLADEHFRSPPAGDATHAFIDLDAHLVALGARKDDGYAVIRGFRT